MRRKHGNLLWKGKGAFGTGVVAFAKPQAPERRSLSPVAYSVWCGAGVLRPVGLRKLQDEEKRRIRMYRIREFSEWRKRKRQNRGWKNPQDVAQPTVQPQYLRLSVERDGGRTPYCGVCSAVRRRVFVQRPKRATIPVPRMRVLPLFHNGNALAYLRAAVVQEHFVGQQNRRRIRCLADALLEL